VFNGAADINLGLIRAVVAALESCEPCALCAQRLAAQQGVWGSAEPLLGVEKEACQGAMLV